MTSTNTDPTTERAEAADQLPYPHRYGHGRMPLFMKLAWLGFLVFGAWYTATFLLDALGAELR